MQRRQTLYCLILTGLLAICGRADVLAQADTNTRGGIGRDMYGDPFSDPPSKSPLTGGNPDNMELKVEIDSNLRTYTIYQKMGNLDYRPVSTMTFQEFAEWQRKRLMDDYWDDPSPLGKGGDSTDLGGFGTLKIGGDEDPIVEITPSGNVTLDFGARWQRVDNPAIPVRQQRNGGFEFDQQISMNVVGKIGDRLKLTANWDTKASFDFDNSIKIDFLGKDIDIIRNVELGNVSFPLKNSLIRGAQNLFGAKIGMQFGKLKVTSLFSSQRGTTQSITIKGGAQTRNFDLRVTDYDTYRHFFLGQYFRDLFEASFRNNPTSPTSGIKITRVEVYKTNSNTKTENTRNIVGFMDLGENSGNVHNNTLITASTPFYMDNGANTLFAQIQSDTTFREVQNTLTNVSGYGYVSGTDFEVIKSARKLTPDVDYVFHADLGYISLTSAIQEEEALAVAFEYTYNGQNYKVGELTEDYQNLNENSVIVLKLLKPQSIKTNLPYWDLMMKNIYSLNTSNVNQENFQLRVIYRDDLTGVDNPTLQEGVNLKDRPLVQVFEMDKLNMNGDLVPDGNFDFIDGATIITRTGKIVFPLLEPFGSYLESQFDPVNEAFLANKYVFNTLYESTKNDAENTPELNKFEIMGSYQSSSAQTVMLPGINISPGSVVVTSGSITLREGTDYTVDYNLGRVSIKNEGILLSGKEITIQYEKSELFNFTRKSLFGTRLDYEVKKNFNVGATWLFLNEQPLLSRVSIGDEPLKNHQFGFDLNLQDKSRIITKMVDFLPGISTKEEADVSLNWEVAGLTPGVTRITKGASVIDDFEGAETPFDLTRVAMRWNLGSTPMRFTESSSDTLDYAYRRAKLAWYNIDNTFYISNNNLGIDEPEAFQANPYTRWFSPQDIFPGQDQFAFQQNEVLFNLAFYPSERGPYNYNNNTTDINTDGTFTRPEENWASITRAVTFDTDFDNANVEYLEFWMLNPFLDSTLNVSKGGGDLYINLGDVSEDVMKDNRHAFENGLPDNVTNTTWGKVTTQQFLTNAFDNNIDRTTQDVGLDGVDNDQEQDVTFFGNFLASLNGYLDPAAYSELEQDPSSDDFKYYVFPDVDTDNRGLLDRYKDFNGLENNSPTNDGNNNFTASNKTFPDNEDLNQDNTISTDERYYEYHLPLRPQFMAPGAHPFVVDKRDVPNVTPTADPTWLLVRIPIKDPNYYSTFGDVNGFKTIKFVRMYMTGFSEPVVLRMAKFQLVSAQWRNYTDQKKLDDPGGKIDDEFCDASFNIGTVNIEENSEGVTNVSSPYKVPPGIIRDIDNISTNVRQLNEQSLRLDAQNLCDGTARAVFKNVGMDLINYDTLSMFIHAETTDPLTTNGQVEAFLRIGTDPNDNYYEVQVPLTFSDVNLSGERDVWRQENDIAVNINDLIQTKVERNTNGAQKFHVYTRTVNGRKMAVKGNPDMSRVMTFMIGMRNPLDDGSEKSAVIWCNELRVVGFNQKAGMATKVNFNTTLPGLGNLSASGSYMSPNYGNIEDKISQRSREHTLEYGVAANLNMDKFLPKESRIAIPLYASFDQKRVSPQFNPLDPDVKMRDALGSFTSDSARDDFKKKAISKTTTKTINLTNVKIKPKQGAKKRLYSLSNLALSGGYTEKTASGIGNTEIGRGNNLESHLEQNYNGGAGYAYNIQSKPLEPFKKLKFLKSPFLKLIKDFNINFIPNSISVKADLNRRYTRTQNYNSTLTTLGVTPLYEKSFFFNRAHTVRWNLTKSITLGYNSTANAIIDEPDGNKKGDDNITEDRYKDSVWTNIKKLGRMKNFVQNVDATYKLPLDKFPLTNWISSDVSYKAGYNWTASALGLSDTNGVFPLGNLITNNRDISLNGKLNFVKLYNKVPFLKKINTPSRPRRGRPKPKATNADTTKKGKPKKEMKVLKTVMRTIMAVRNLNFRGSLNNGTTLSGFLPVPTYFGMADFGAPGVPFLIGSQDPNIRYEAANSGWLTRSPMNNNPFLQKQNFEYSLRTTVEPIKDFRMQLDVKRSRGNNYSEIFRTDTSFYQTGIENWLTYSPLTSGSFSTSYITLNTLGFLDLGGNKSDQNFAQFEQTRYVVKSILDQKNNGIGEYGANSQDVLIPAFLSAYSGVPIKDDKLNPFPKIPLPNWRIDYSGLARIKKLRKKFSSINLTHSYKSTYTISNYTSSLEYDSTVINPFNDLGSNILPSDTNGLGIYIPTYVLNQVNITERFSPLIGINVRTRKRMNFKIEYKTERNLTLSMSNAQLTEINNKDIVFGFGFTKRGMNIPNIFKPKAPKIKLEKDVTFKVDMQFRDTKTVQRTLEGPTVVTAGNISFRLNPNISYAASQKLNIQIFFERTFNEPRISSSFRRSSTAFGVRIRFSLA